MSDTRTAQDLSKEMARNLKAKRRHDLKFSNEDRTVNEWYPDSVYKCSRCGYTTKNYLDEDLCLLDLKSEDKQS